MDEKEFLSLLNKGAKELSITIGEGEGALFLKYLRELKTWNRKINLTSIDSDREILIRHFLDSLTALPFTKGPARLLDMGAGGGFPGLPLKIIEPSLQVTLIDSVEKKVNFMRHIIRTLGLKDAHAFAVRAEDRAFIEKHWGAFDMVISRAFTELKGFVELSLPYLAPGGRIIAIKGPAAREELKGIEGIEGLTAPEVHEVKVPLEERANTIIILKKSA